MIKREILKIYLFGAGIKANVIQRLSLTLHCLACTQPIVGCCSSSDVRSRKIRLNEAIQRSVCNSALVVGYCVLYFAFLYIYLPFCIFVVL